MYEKKYTMKRQKGKTLKDELPRWVGAQYATRDQWRNNSRKNEETWNVRSMNQGKLEVIEQEMARVNINILGISELKWTRMGEFNSDDHCIYYRQESLRRNGVAILVNKRV